MPNQTLKSILKIVPSKPKFQSSLALKVYHLYSKDIDKFSVEDLRVMISQNIHVNIFMPMALNLLIRNPLISGDYYSGDLLKAVLSIPYDYWESDQISFEKVVKILDKFNSEFELSNNEYLSDAIKTFSEYIKNN